MIRRETDDGWILITQHDHGVLAGDILKHWGNERFSEPDPFDEVLLAAKEHDYGWIEWDSRPEVNPENGFPANFMEMKSGDQADIWGRSSTFLAESHPYASSLIALHFERFNMKLLERNPSDASALSFKSNMESLLARNLGAVGTSTYNGGIPEDVKINLRLLQVADIISLAVCHGWENRVIHEVPLDYSGAVTDQIMESADGFNFGISPYPFSIPLLELRIRGRKLSRRSFSSDVELRKCLEAAEPVALDFTIGKG